MSKGKLTSQQAELAETYFVYALKLARSLARQYHKGFARYRYTDYESAAVKELMHAVQRFDPTKGTKFSTYLYHRRRNILRTVKKDMSSPPVRPVSRCREDDSLTFEELLDFVPSRYHAILRAKYVDGMSQKEIAKELGYSQQWVSVLIQQAYTIIHEELVG